mmetsp:Transcript_58488/g.163943  ORF Transcript_58488/g.163943 Transcript_58488/m.163943 type:complete len:218 (+) Transcript_58488:994-1647(+)
MCFARVLSSDRPQSNMFTWVAFRVLSAPSAERSGRRPHSKPSATELPIHFCGTGHFRQAMASSKSLRITSWLTSSATSMGASTLARSPWPGSAGSWWTSKKCVIISEAGRHCSMMRVAFLTVFSFALAWPPTSSNGSMELRAGGRLSKPSRRKPSADEFVMPSTKLCRTAASLDLPCQPACAVTCPILMSNIRSLVYPSRRFRMTSRSLIGPSCPPC